MRLLFISLLMCLTANAQITYEKGYFIKNNNEKVICFIKNIDWKDNPTKFEYKTDFNESKSTTVTIADVSEFSIDGESKFKRFEVSIEKSDVVLNNLTENKNPVWQKATLFLKALIEGDASLYSYSEGNLLKFFYVTQTVPVEQLVAVSYKSPDGDVAVNSIFRQQLFNHVKKDNMVTADFKSLEYNANSLIRHFSKYNNANGVAASTYLTKKEKNVFNIRVTAGITSAKLSISDPGDYNSLSTDMSKTTYRFGAEAEYVLPFNKNKWAIVVNPTYGKFDTEKKFTNTIPGFPPHDVDHSASVKYTSLEIPLGIRYYMFLNKSSKIFISALYSANFSKGSEIVFDNGSSFNINPASNAVVGLGYTFKDRYSLEIRLNSSRELFSNYLEWSAKYTPLNIQFSYKVF